jgi:uncharacterized cofD-like protein
MRQGWKHRLVRSRLWLQPGLGVKRWLALLLVGVALLGLALALALVNAYRTAPPTDFMRILTLQFLPRLLRAGLVGGLGLAAASLALYRLNQSLLAPFVMGSGEPVVEALHRHRQRQKGPHVVAIGGGTGLSNLLRGLKAYTANITAIVTVADDGGSSGRLRRDLGVLPPGDIRNCLAALANDEALMTQLFQYRFAEGAGLNGHSFGNLFISAMAGVTGSFERAVLESGHVLAVQGQIIPSTLEDVTLCADLREGLGADPGGLRRVEGESVIPTSGQPIERVFLRPDRVHAYPAAVRAILDADLIVAGPGSLFTSILPNLLVEGIPQAIRSSRGVKVFVCNVANQAGETDGYRVDDYVSALRRHVGCDLFAIVVADSGKSDYPVAVRVGPNHARDYQLVVRDLVDRKRPTQHDPETLASSLMGILEQYRVARHGSAGISLRR